MRNPARGAIVFPSGNFVDTHGNRRSNPVRPNPSQSFFLNRISGIVRSAVERSAQSNLSANFLIAIFCLPGSIRYGGSVPKPKTFLSKTKHTPGSPDPSDEAYLRLLRLLENNPHMSQRDLADALDVSLGKTNYCLKALLDKGYIKIQNFRNSQNKLAYAYFLTPEGIAEKAGLTARFLKRKVAEYERLKHEIDLLTLENGNQ